MSNRTSLSLFAALAVCLTANAQNPKKEKPYSELPVIQKKEPPLNTQVLPLPKEPPPAVSAETDKLVFSTAPLSGKGLLSQQTREAMRALVRAKGGQAIIKLRAFVAGSGDVRRVQEIAGEVFGEKHLNLPALSVVLVGALPLEGAQVNLEVTSLEKKTVNPSGLGFFAAQQAPSIAEAAAKLKAAFGKAGLDAGDAVRVTCFVNSFEGAGDWHGAVGSFSGAAVTVVQMMREPAGPPAACEGVARLRKAPDREVLFIEGPAVLVNAPKVVVTGIQMAFGRKKEDVQQVYERMNRVLSPLRADFSTVVSSETYLLFSSVAEAARGARTEASGKSAAPADTMLPFEGLASLDASMGLEVVAFPRP